MRRIFVDLEMNPVAKEYEEVKKTCSMETIEIGAVILDEDKMKSSLRYRKAEISKYTRL